MIKTRPMVLFLITAVLSSGFVVSPSARARPKPANPDFTRGGQTDGSHDWTLGATGARGWIYAWKHSADARQILITEVAQGSPSDGVLEVNDVILGIDNKPFDDDARILFARAVMRAEEETGVLRLLRWRAGESKPVEIRLRVMGTYSATAPYDCPKSLAIFERGCEAIAKRGLETISIPDCINALALLASGKAEYRPMLSSYARKVAEFRTDGFATWIYGYAVTYLAEYVMATGDQSVTPGLERLALASARGQSRVGTWGHKFAMPDGRLGGYGCMNQPGISLSISMVLARKAGVIDPDLDQAIQRSAGFLCWYVNKGAIPYGDHPPWPGHEDNGKCSSAAVFFDLLGDREAAEFFARMSTAAYDERERGHTGNFFNLVWAMPGVSRCGPLATGAYWREQAWYYDLARGWDGSFRYQGSPVGEEEHRKYTRWDNTGTYLLAYALARKSLCITGKNAPSVPALTSSEVNEVIAAGRGYFPTKGTDPFLYRKRSNKELIAGLSSWSPAVRKRSVAELGKREGDFVPQLMNLLASSHLDSRYGAVEALGKIGSKENSSARVEALTQMLQADDLWLRILAAEALAAIGAPARSAVPVLLERFQMNDAEEDPREMEQRALCVALFDKRRGLIGQSLDGVDRNQLINAVRIGLKNEDGRARAMMASVYQNLSFEEIEPLLPAIKEAIVEPAPSGIMFSNGIRLAGVELFSRHRIREGIPLCLDVMDIDKWGKKDRISRCLAALEGYGAAAKPVIPRLRALETDLSKHRETKSLKPLIERVQAIITSLENATETVELRSVDAP